MPRATTSVETQRFDLETCEGGYVVLRRLNYGERKRVESMAMKFRMSAAGSDPDEPRDQNVSIDMAAVLHYQFSKSIVEHNLEDEKGRTLDFSNPKDFDSLDDSIGEEIETLIVTYDPAKTETDGESPLASKSGKPSAKDAQKTQK